MSHTNSTPKPEASMSGHTPGPWHIVTDEHGNTEIITDSRPYICTVAPGKCEDVTVANARLIAAAPDMRSLLLQIHTELSNTASADADPANWEGYTMHRIEKLLWPENAGGNHETG
ncbi:hypothetical protein CO610_07260 [Lysobacteraceae bacterium NML95-0200]|nr:hypothetical protein CO610_07260 [Xanthomonadaceae bacterium NML95-0200]